jgi:hypothetical protein
MVADEGLGIAVSVIGEPALPTLVDVETKTDKLVGFVVEYKPTTATITIAITTTARTRVRFINFPRSDDVKNRPTSLIDFCSSCLA